MEEIYIVTGAAGHLGSVITEKLNERGKTVYALCLPGEERAPHGENISVFLGDVRDTGSLTGMFEQCAGKAVTVIHCAGIVTISNAFGKNVRAVNVQGTKNIVSLCEEFKVNKLVYISSVHAIPEQPRGKAITEIVWFSPSKVVGLYAKTKAKATQCVLDYISRGNDGNVVHPSGILGPSDFGGGHLTQMIIDYCKGRLTSAVNGGYDFVDVRDVADGVLSCCEQGKRGECFILSGKFFKILDVLNLLHHITGRKRIDRILPRWFVKLTAPLSEIYYRILKQPPLYTTYSIYTLGANANFSHEKAAKELGFYPRPLSQTLIDTVNWLKDNDRI